MLQRLTASLTTLLIVSVSSVSAVSAQQEPPPEPENVEVAPISCWWQTSTPAVRVGERFRLTLTCAVLENDDTRVVPDESRLEPAAVQIPPFEIMAGARGDDLRTAQRRMFQYEYDTRLIIENGFGVDFSVPSLEIAYTVESSVGAGEALQGREQTYTMPPLPLRVQSLVAQDATDIRTSAGGPSLADIEARAARASLLRAVAMVLFTLAGLMVVVAIVGAARRRMTPAAAGDSPLHPARTLARGAADALADVARQRQIEGWTPDLTARALAAGRITAALATGAAVGQYLPVEDQLPRDGELLVSGGFPTRTTVVVSAGVTAERLGRNPRKPKAERSSEVVELADALGLLTAARYGREDGGDAAAMDEALGTLRRAADRVRARHTVIAELVAGVRQSAAEMGARVWSR